MKRVVCINDCRFNTDKSCKVPLVVVGKIYTVIDTQIRGGIEYYVLLEMGKYNGYWVGSFVDLVEDQQDETEMVRNYEKDNATV